MPAKFSGVESPCLLRVGATSSSTCRTASGPTRTSPPRRSSRSSPTSTANRGTPSPRRLRRSASIRSCTSACARCPKGLRGVSSWRSAFSRRTPFCSWTNPSTGSICARRARSLKCCVARRQTAGRSFLPSINLPMPSASAIASSCSPTAACTAAARLPRFDGRPASLTAIWRRCSLRSPDGFAMRRAPLRPLLVKEMREIVSGRALWTLLLVVCPLIGYSFFQAVSLYGEASAAALQTPVMASGLSPLDGVLVPTLGASYVAGTLLFPFVAIRVLGHEKESGALRLLVQLPYRTPALIGAKLVVILAAWLIAMIPALSSLPLWRAFGGH